MRNEERLLILAEGHLGVFSSKTATCVIRYCPRNVVAVLDSRHAGDDLAAVLGVGDGIPIVSSVTEALPLRPTALLIGIAPRGGELPAEWRDILRAAIDNGLDVISGLHTFLSDDADLSQRARQRGVRLYDVRRPPDGIPLGRNIARTLPALRVLTVGTDCSVGKMVTSVELDRCARDRGWRSQFVATGQTGIMISGAGVPIDRVISDFVPGAIEDELLRYRDADLLSVEGQGSLIHPAYSGVTLGLIHGCAPDGLILCHHAGRRTIKGNEEVPLPTLPEMVDLHHAVTRHLYPTRVIGISLNCVGLTDEAARRCCEEAARTTGLPATDPIRFGSGPLMDAVERLRAEAR